MSEEMKAADGTVEVMETMETYAAELEASFKKVKEGDVLTGTVISVNEDMVILDLKYYAEGIISKENLSNDPEFNLLREIQPGRRDYGCGHKHRRRGREYRFVQKAGQ